MSTMAWKERMFPRMCNRMILALEWYVRAAEEGYPRGLFYVANMCFESVILKQSANCAEQLAMAAAKKGCVKAHELLGVIYIRRNVRQTRRKQRRQNSSITLSLQQLVGVESAWRRSKTFVNNLANLGSSAKKRSMTSKRSSTRRQSLNGLKSMAKRPNLT